MSEDKPSKTKIIAPEEPESVIRPEQDVALGDEQKGQLAVPDVAAVMIIRNTVVFPGAVLPLTVGREKSSRLIDTVLPDEKVIVLLTQRDERVEDPSPEELYEVGVASVVLRLLRTDEGHQRLIVHGLVRVHIDEFVQTEPFFRAKITPMSDHVTDSTELEARLVDVRQKAQTVIQLSPNVPDEAQAIISSIDEPGALADFLSANMPLEVAIKQQLLAETDVLGRLKELQGQLHHQVEVLKLSGQLQEQVRASINKDQREYFLREQLKAIRKELGQEDEQAAEVLELDGKIKEAEMGQAVRDECYRQVRRLERVPAASPEYTVIRTYLDVMTELPWAKLTKDRLDIRRARRVLDEDHYDLDKVKKRILEYLAVRKLAPDSRGPILCFVGPPGVGKTSLGQSIARALGREFIRMSLGGLRDEAELRGHRRTYIGAMPGRIIQEIRNAGSRNPVFMLDELDKVGSDFRGDPTSALLEILDPAQNFSFQDRYLNVPFDLSQVMFIGTANVMATVPPALRDRMEVIDLPGYTLAEKLNIAERYLVPRQLKENGLTSREIKFQKSALRQIILYYTREAGVRQLERQIGAICRSVAARVAAGTGKARSITAKQVASFLGPREFESELARRTAVPGVATGLAYTAYGGEIIFVEATAFPGKGNLILTGHIGTVMKESVQAALSLIRSRSKDLGIDPRQFGKLDIHVHVPAGAVPKDGPSAGVAMATALGSLMLSRPVRAEVAMTGEITLRGLVLPVGGVKEKVLAARQAGIKTVILPERNRRHVADVPAEVRKQLRFVFASTVDDVLKAALGPARKRAARKSPTRKSPRKKP